MNMWILLKCVGTWIVLVVDWFELDCKYVVLVELAQHLHPDPATIVLYFGLT